MKKRWSTAQKVLAGVGGTLVGAALVTLVLVQVNRWQINLELNGDADEQLEYGQTYTEENAEAYFSGTIFHRRPTPVDVEVSGAVDATKVGTYTITYTATEKDVVQVARRTVHVVDTTPPEIVLQNVEGYYTLPGAAYVEEGFTATDSHDGDLTAEVSSEEKEGKVYYSVRDEAGNEGTAVREIFYDDPVPPEITLLGSAEETAIIGSPYAESGYTAVDNVDGDITDRVEVSGTVDYQTAGTYTLTYTVRDSYENEASAQRTVKVIAPQPQSASVANVPTDKVVYLTFDDGPGPYTAQLLDLLARYNVKATFFVTNAAPGYQNMIGREAAEGHAIGVHSYTHNYGRIYASEDAFFADFNAMNDIIAAQTGSRTTMMRFPGGSSNTVSRKYNTGIMTRLVADVTNYGYVYFDWNVMSGDAGQTKDTATVAANVIAGIQQHSVSIVLQHDSKGFSVAAVEQILQWGLANGYTFLPLTPYTHAVHQRVVN